MWGRGPGLTACAEQSGTSPESKPPGGGGRTRGRAPSLSLGRPSPHSRCGEFYENPRCHREQAARLHPNSKHPRRPSNVCLGPPRGPSRNVRPNAPSLLQTPTRSRVTLCPGHTHNRAPHALGDSFPPSPWVGATMGKGGSPHPPKKGACDARQGACVLVGETGSPSPSESSRPRT